MNTYKTKQMDFCVRKFEKYFNDPKNRVIFHLKHVEVIEDMELINILLNTIKNDPDKLVRHAAVCTLSETVPTTKIRMGPIIRSLIHATSDPEEKVRVQATKTLCTLLTRRELKGKLTVKLATEITERLFEIIKNETETTKLRGVAFQSLYEIIKHTDLELDFKDIFNKLLEVTDKLISLKQGKKTCQVLRYLQTKKKCPFPEEMRRALTDEYNIKFFDRYNPLTLEEMYRSIDRKHKEQTFAVCFVQKNIE